MNVVVRIVLSVVLSVVLRKKVLYLRSFGV